MTEPRTGSVHGGIDTTSDEHTKKLNEETVAVHHNDARFTSNYFQSNEENWKHSTPANSSSDDDLPLAGRSTRRAAATAMSPPNMSQISPSEPRRRRRGGPPLWENTQLYQDEGTSLAVSASPMRRSRPNTPPSHGSVDFQVYQEEAMFEADEEMAKRLQDQFKKEAGFSGTASYNAHRPAGLASDPRTQWGGLPIDSGSDIFRTEEYDVPVKMQDVHGHAGSNYRSAYPVYSTDSIPRHPANQDTGQSDTAFSLSNHQAVRNTFDQQRPAHDSLLVQSICWQNRFDHLPFRTSCNFCFAEMIVCSTHHPSYGYCYQHGLPRNYNNAPVHNAGLEDVYDALHQDPPRNNRQSSGVRKLVNKPKPPRVVPLKMQEAILKELHPKEDERGPPMA